MKNLLDKSLKSGLVVLFAISIQYIAIIISQIWMARILEPENFGQFALSLMVVSFFHNLLNTHGDKYIIKENHDIEVKLDTIFSIELMFIIAIGIPALISLQYLMSFVNKPDLTSYVQVLMLMLLYNPFSKPRSLFERNLFFIKARLPLVLASIVGGVIGVIMAYSDYGIWSLIAWKLSINILEIVLLWIIIPYRPRFTFDFFYLKDIIRFGMPMLGASVVVFIYMNYGYYLIDNLLGAKQLGYFWLAYQMTHHFLVFKTAINSVILPTFSRMKSLPRKFDIFKVLTDLIGLIYLLIVAVSIFFGKELITIILGESWIPAVVPLQISFIIIFIKGIGGTSGPLLYSQGISKPDFILSVWNVILMIPFVFIATTKFGINGTASANLLVTFLLAIYSYEKFVLPLTGNGFSYYFKKHLFGLLFTITIFLIVTFFNWNFYYKVLSLVSSLFILYQINYKSIWIDIKSKISAVY